MNNSLYFHGSARVIYAPTPLVAHNAPFEQRFIAHLAIVPAPTPLFVDTLALARITYHQVLNHKLVTLCEHLSYSLKDAHRALPDAKATAFLLADIVRRNPSAVNQFRPPAAQIAQAKSAGSPPPQAPVKPQLSAASSPAPAPVSPPQPPCRAPGGLSFGGGVSYVGEVLNGRPDGKGRMRWPGGSVYVGDFVAGQRTGKGEYRWIDGPGAALT